MTQSPTGESSPSPLSALWRATSVPQESWSPRIPAFVPSCKRSIEQEKKDASLRKEIAIAPSKLEAEFARQVKDADLPPPQREYKFDKKTGRQWRFDFAWPDKFGGVAVECEGGIFNGGRHVHPSGFLNDCEKYAAAQLQGWIVLRVASPHLKSGEAIQWTKEALGL